jgi:hypothetical protein
MANTTTLNEATRSPVTGSDYIRLATPGANWKATVFNTVGSVARLERQPSGGTLTVYVRYNVGNVAISNATPAVVTLNSHGLQIGDTVAFSITPNRSAPGAVTLTIASPCVVTRTAHGYAAGQPIVFNTTGTLPTGITAGTTYYVIAAGLAANTFEFSTTVGGSAVNTSGSQVVGHYVEATGSIPTGITAGTIYYVISPGFGVNSFQISASAGGSAINTTTNQSGTISMAEGNDEISGWTTSQTHNNCFMTIAAAMTFASTIDMGGFYFIVQLADSVYNEQVTLPEMVGAGSANAQLVGNSTFLSNCVLLQSGNPNIECVGSPWSINNIKLSGGNIGVQGSGTIGFGGFAVNLEFNNISSYCWAPQAPGNLTFTSSTIYLTGTPPQWYILAAGPLDIEQSSNAFFIFSTVAGAWQWINVQGNLYTLTDSQTFTGGGVITGSRYNVTLNAVIDTRGGGANYFPGSTAGSTATGGQYA